jgi:hypothetical protein
MLSQFSEAPRRTLATGHHFFDPIFTALPRPEVSSMRNVATCTSTGLRQRGHRGLLVAAAMPSRYDRGTPHEGHGRNDAVAIRHLTAAASGSSDSLIGDICTSCWRTHLANARRIAASSRRTSLQAILVRA